MKKLAIPTMMLSTLLFACAGNVNNEETTVTETKEETIEEVVEAPEISIIEMQVETTYNGSNVQVNNPYSSTGVGFCVKDVLVNGTSAGINVETESLEIDLAVLEIENGASVAITVIHEEACLPEVITD